MTDNAPLRDIYSVSRLNSEVRSVLGSAFQLVWLEGELSNLACPASGHWYFSLKDSHAQVRCAMFRTRNRLLRFSPRNGIQVLVRAKIGLYEPRGEFQLVIEHMEEAGEGALRLQFEQLKNKLNAEGLFASEHKKPLPAFAKTVGVITSPSGAAIHDVLTTIKRRFANLNVIIYPTSVQGKPAAKEIAETIALANKRNECDVLLVTRGGGSLEDLWSFNEEVVARAIFNSPLPVISAVGHDVDFTIADFVADVRAATPTAAAELVSPDATHYVKQLNSLQARLIQAVNTQITIADENLKRLAKSIVHPQQYIEQTSQRLDEISYRLNSSVSSKIAAFKLATSQLTSRLGLLNPVHRIHIKQDKTIQLLQRLASVQQNSLSQFKQRFIRNTSRLEAMSPLSILNRGYAYVTLADTDTIIKDIRQIKAGVQVKTRLATGSFISTVTKTGLKK